VAKLEALLKSILDGAKPTGLDWQVVVADNASSDATPELVSEFAKIHPGRFYHVRSLTVAKAAGLNAAIRAARGGIIALVDDDVRVDGTWMTELIRAYSIDPELDGFGGRVELFDPTAAPIAVRRSLLPAVLTGGSLHMTEIPVLGCNLSFRRAALEAVGLYDDLFGPGSTVGSGDDADIVYRIHRSGAKLMYLPQVLVYHDHGRRSADDTAPIYRRYCRGRGGLYCKYIARGDMAALKLCYYEVHACCARVLRALWSLQIDGAAFQDLATLAGGALAYARAALAKCLTPRLRRVERPRT
jgi:GT2 family glycosyltransferase